MTMLRFGSIAAVVTLLAACSDNETSTSNTPLPDSGADVAPDAPPADASPDEGVDMASDASPDLGVDASPDVGVDAGVDASADVGVDASDLAADTSVDVLADAAPCEQVELTFEGKVWTVSGNPVGLSSAAYNKPVTGKLSYKLCVLDSKAADPQRGKYDHGSGGIFELTVETASIVGSTKPIVTVEDITNSSDTFRWEDGDVPIDSKDRTMSLNGQPHPSLWVWIAITDTTGNAWTSDALPTVFPFSNITDYSHTFSVKDDAGTLLLQLSSITQL